MLKFIKSGVIFFMVVSAYAQDINFLPILTTSPSAKLNAMAGLGVALPTGDAYGQFYNPAQVAYAARRANFSIHFLPGGQNLSGNSKPELKSSAASLGYQLRGRDEKRSVSLGIGYVNSDLDLGEIFFTDSLGNIRQSAVRNENYYSITLGLGFTYFIDIHLGLTHKWITTNPGFVQISQTQIARAIDNLGTWDYGFMLTAPLHRWIFSQAKDKKLRPMLDFSLGYSKSNTGGEVKYNEFIPDLPLPRTARLGYSIRGGLGITYERKKFQAFEAYFSVEANDILVTRDGNNFSYQGFLGDIDVSKHIIKARGDDNVTSRVGYGLELFETVYLAGGFYEGAGFDQTQTFGFGIRTKGVFRLFQKKYTKNAFSFIFDSMDFQYYTSVYSVFPGDEVRFHGVMVSVAGF